MVTTHSYSYILPAPKMLIISIFPLLYQVITIRSRIGSTIHHQYHKSFIIPRLSRQQHQQLTYHTPQSYLSHVVIQTPSSTLCSKTLRKIFFIKPKWFPIKIPKLIHPTRSINNQLHDSFYDLLIMKESNQETKLNMEDTNRLSISSHLNIAFQVQAATSHLTNE